MVVRFLLDDSGNWGVPLSAVIKTDSSGRITQLNLRGLDFSNGIFFDIIKLGELRVLDLGRTGLPNMFPNIKKLANLEVLRVDNNNLTFFSSTIGGCLKLKELDLSNNKLADLPVSLVNCSSLTVLHVEGNKLCLVNPAMSGFLDNFNKQWRLGQLCQ
jgi:Leucine-rich repeat (LRR) protein